MTDRHLNKYLLDSLYANSTDNLESVLLLTPLEEASYTLTTYMRDYPNGGGAVVDFFLEFVKAGMTWTDEQLLYLTEGDLLETEDVVELLLTVPPKRLTEYMYSELLANARDIENYQNGEGPFLLSYLPVGHYSREVVEPLKSLLESVVGLGVEGYVPDLISERLRTLIGDLELCRVRSNTTT